MVKVYEEVQGGLYTGDSTTLANQFRPFWAIITEVDGYRYGWTEVLPVATMTFSPLLGGRYGSATTNPAWEANCNPTYIGSYVLLVRAYFDTTYDWTYLIIYRSPSGNICGGSGSGSGAPSDCPCVATCYSVTFPGVSSDPETIGCQHCDLLTVDVLLYVVADCLWEAYVFACEGSIFPSIRVGFSVQTINGHVNGVLTASAYNTLSAQWEVQATYSSDNLTDWDCTTPLVLDGGGVAQTYPACVTASWPASITVRPCESNPNAPTVNTSTDDVCDVFLGPLTMTGNNFMVPASTNTVTLTDSSMVELAGVTVISGDANTLVVEWTEPPIPAAGALDAVVSNTSGTSDSAQVATVVECPVITRTARGSTSASGLAPTASMSVTLPADDYLVVFVGRASALAGPLQSVKFNSVSMDALVDGNDEFASGFGVAVQAFGLSGGVTSGAHTLEVVGAAGEVSLLLVNAETVSGLTFGASDGTTATGNGGTSSTVDMGNLGPTEYPNEIAYGLFMMGIPGGSYTPQNGMTTCGQDVSGSLSGTTFTLATMYEVVSPDVGSFYPELDITALSWSGAGVSLE